MSEYELVSPEVAEQELRTVPVIGLDLETLGLSSRDDKVRLMQLSDGERTFVVDVFKYPDLTPLEGLMGNEKVVKVGQNLKFDLSFLLQQHQIHVWPIFDTMIAAHLLGLQGSASLKSLAMIYLDRSLPKEEQRSDWATELTESQLEYAAHDAQILLPLREGLKKDLERDGLGKVAKIEFAALPAIVSMELNGLRVDLDHIERLRLREEGGKRKAHIKFESYLDESGYAFQQMALEGFDPKPRINLGSPKQILEAFEKMGVGNVEGTSVEALAKVSHPAAKTLLEHRKHAKRLDAFLEPLPKLVHPKTRRIHPTFHQTRTVTGRIAHAHPNVATIPHEQEFRDIFVAEDGNVLVAADYSGQELRVLAEISQDEAMIKAFTEGVDLHTFTSSGMFNVEVGEVTKEQRDMGKKCSFALLYGSGPKRIAGLLDVSEKRAEELIEGYFDTYPQVGAWMRSVERTGVSQGFVRTLAGRKCKLSTDNANRAKREAVNYSIQGTSADMTKLALHYVHRAFKDFPEVLLVNTIHDELLVECPKDMELKVTNIVGEEMIAAGEVFVHKVPIEVDAASGKSWQK